MKHLPAHLQPLAGQSFGSFAELSAAINRADAQRAKGLKQTAAARRANRERGR